MTEGDSVGIDALSEVEFGMDASVDCVVSCLSGCLLDCSVARNVSCLIISKLGSDDCCPINRGLKGPASWARRLCRTRRAQAITKFIVQK